MNSLEYKREEFDSASGSIKNQFCCNFSFLAFFSGVEIARKLKKSFFIHSPTNLERLKMAQWIIEPQKM